MEPTKSAEHYKKQVWFFVAMSLLSVIVSLVFTILNIKESTTFLALTGVFLAVAAHFHIFYVQKKSSKQ